MAKLLYYQKNERQIRAIDAAVELEDANLATLEDVTVQAQAEVVLHDGTDDTPSLECGSFLSPNTIAMVNVSEDVEESINFIKELEDADKELTTTANDSDDAEQKEAMKMFNNAYLKLTKPNPLEQDFTGSIKITEMTAGGFTAMIDLPQAQVQKIADIFGSKIGNILSTEPTKDAIGFGITVPYSTNKAMVRGIFWTLWYAENTAILGAKCKTMVEDLEAGKRPKASTKTMKSSKAKARREALRERKIQQRATLAAFEASI